jgi:hypothetical protein
MKQRQRRTHVPGLLAILAVVVALAVVVGGFILNGSPSKRRDLRLDQQRVDNLRTIAGAINGPVYAPPQEVKPQPLSESLASLLKRQDVGLSADQTLDPVSKQPYEYRKLSDTTYELCAVFARSSDEADPAAQNFYGFQNNDFWKHPAGKKCFTIDATRGVY